MQGVSKPYTKYTHLWLTNFGPTSFVCATHRETSETVQLTSYRRRRGPQDRLNAVKIWEACRATSAATSFYDPIRISMGNYSEEFLDGGTGANNPIHQLWNEAKDAWAPESLVKNLKCIVSIGTGSTSVEYFDVGLLRLDVLKSLSRIATETEQTADSFQRTHSELDDNEQYFRFNVRNGLENVELEDSSQKDRVMSMTNRYIEISDVWKKIESCGNCLAERECALAFA